MVVIPGLSQPLEAVGKRIIWWDEGEDGLAVGARSVVRQAARPRCACDKRTGATDAGSPTPFALAVRFRSTSRRGDSSASTRAARSGRFPTASMRWPLRASGARCG